MGISTVRRPLVMMLVVAAIAGCASPPPAPQPVVNRPDPAALALDAAARRPMPEHTRSEAAAPVQAVLNGPVSAIMTSDVTTCSADDEVESLARTMTQQRIRHVPVLADGRLEAIVSIGDVVKHRIDALQSERDQLVEYIQQ